jgi:hypothetical protein
LAANLLQLDAAREERREIQANQLRDGHKIAELTESQLDELPGIEPENLKKYADGWGVPGRAESKTNTEALGGTTDNPNERRPIHNTMLAMEAGHEDVLKNTPANTQRAADLMKFGLARAGMDSLDVEGHNPWTNTGKTGRVVVRTTEVRRWLEAHHPDDPRDFKTVVRVLNRIQRLCHRPSDSDEVSRETAKAVRIVETKRGKMLAIDIEWLETHFARGDPGGDSAASE